MGRPNASRLEGSAQCASSRTSRTGDCARSPRPGLSEPPSFFAASETGRGPNRYSGRRSAYLGEKHGIFSGGGGHRKQRVELVERRLRVLFLREPGAPGQMADDRVERGVSMLRRAEKAQPRIRLTCKPLQKGRGEPRLADARFAREQDDMPLPFLRLDPGTKQKPNLLFATHERAEPAGVQRVEPARLGALAHHRPGERRPGDALSSCGLRSSSSNRSPSSLRVTSAMTTPSGGAIFCSRAARFGVSPTTAGPRASSDPTRSPTTTIPVAMPNRACSGAWAAVLSFGDASAISSPARTARSASCSCACG